MRESDKFGRAFAMEKLSDSVSLYFFDHRDHKVEYEDMLDRLSVDLAHATNGAITIVPSMPLFCRGVLIVIINPLRSHYYTEDLCNDMVEQFFTSHRIGADDDDDDYDLDDVEFDETDTF